MKADALKQIRQEIIDDPENREFTEKGWLPLYTISPQSKIIVIGQAPGIKTQEKNVAWRDLSGDKLRQWLGVTIDEFYDTDNFAQIPMDFYYPGKAKSGDKPPRKNFAQKWHPKLLAQLDQVELIILIGNYSQKHYLKDLAKKNLTETVHAFKEYLPTYFPLAHPSPLNIRWFVKNPWYETDVLPELKKRVQKILKK